MVSAIQWESTQWEKHLAGTGYRVTASRQAVVQALCAADAPLSPVELLERARAVHHRLGMVTVYRTLHLLTQLKMVRRVHRPDGCHGYLPAWPGHHHAVICRGCGRAAEFPGEDDLGTLVERVEADTGYRVEGHLLQLEGLCPVCQDTVREG